jgi:hypothetical protein
MERIEIEILETLGVSNPYSEPAATSERARGRARGQLILNAK